MTANFEWFVSKELHINGYRVSARIKTPNAATGYSIAMPVTMAVLMEEGLHHPDFMALSQMSAQNLMDELWSCGVRPSNGAGNNDLLAATKYHLEDMREIVKGYMEFKK